MDASTCRPRAYLVIIIRPSVTECGCFGFCLTCNASSDAVALFQRTSTRLSDFSNIQKHTILTPGLSRHSDCLSEGEKVFVDRQQNENRIDSDTVCLSEGKNVFVDQRQNENKIKLSADKNKQTFAEGKWCALILESVLKKFGWQVKFTIRRNVNNRQHANTTPK